MRSNAGHVGHVGRPGNGRPAVAARILLCQTRRFNNNQEEEGEGEEEGEEEEDGGGGERGRRKQLKPKQKKNDMFVGRCAVSRTVDSLQIKSCAIYTPDLVPFIWDPLGFFGIFWDSRHQILSSSKY